MEKILYRGEGMSRRDTVDHIVEDMAWENPRRIQISEDNPQNVLGEFRNYLCSKFAYMQDDEIPYKWQEQRKFIQDHWAQFIYRFYGIIQTWKEYKNSDAYRKYSCSVKN